MKLVKTLIIAEGANPALLDVEITESVMSDKAILDAAFQVFQELGITVSIDDFGSGYSALGNLNKFPFDRIKIDQSLIKNLTMNSTSGINIVRAAINMSHASGIKAIAEGVETSEQLDILTMLDCDQVQGYYPGRPVPAHVFQERYISRQLKAAGVLTGNTEDFAAPFI
jgi:EAL domain-containing protein (putative c-di-GMP-specific phosphodiesterase class I)